MTKENTKFRSKQRIVRGLGSAHGGVHHWWLERVTAIALIPLSLWFVVSLMRAMLFPESADVVAWMASPINALLMSLLVIAGFWHAAMGNQVILEDYVHCPLKKFSLIIINNFICFSLAAVSLLAIVKMHLHG